jgi:hypothetical protein
MSSRGVLALREMLIILCIPLGCTFLVITMLASDAKCIRASGALAYIANRRLTSRRR